MKKKYSNDAMKQALEKESGNKVASLHYFQLQKKPARKKKDPPEAPPEEHARGELLLDRTPVNFDLSLLKQQIDLLQEGMLSIHEKLAAFETAKGALQEENIKLKENNKKGTPPSLERNAPEKGQGPYRSHRLPTGVTVYRDKTTGDCLCPQCLEGDNAAIRIRPYRIRVSTISYCPRCQNEFPTEKSERSPIKILPPEDQSPAKTEPPAPGTTQNTDGSAGT